MMPSFGSRGDPTDANLVMSQHQGGSDRITDTAWSGCLLAIIAVGLGLRWLVLLPLSTELHTDPDLYVAHARMVADGQGLAGPYTGRPTAFRPPAMPVLIAGFLWSGLDVPAGVVIIQSVCSVLVIWLTARLAADLGVRPGVSLVAAALVALDPLLVRYSVVPMSEVPSACLLAACLVLWVTATARCHIWEPGSFGCRDHPLWAGIGCGLCFGAFAMLRPVAVVVLGLLVVWELRPWNGAGGAPLRRRALCCGVVVVGCLSGMAPWIIRNAVQLGALIPATTHGGYTLALGNNPEYYRDVVQGRQAAWSGDALRAWQQRSEVAARDAGIRRGDEVAEDRWMYRQAIESIRQSPKIFLRACFLRFRRFWAVTPAVVPVEATGSAVGLGNVDGEGSSSIRSLRRLFLSLASLMTGVWYILLWCGVAVCLFQSSSSRPPRPRSVLWIPIIAFLMVHVIYWTDTRMRAPLMPVLAIAGATGWAGLTAAVCRIRRC